MTIIKSNMEPKIIIELTAEQEKALSRKVNGSGGWQTILRKLQSKSEEGSLSLSPTEVGKILRYSRKYGAGGFQDRLTGIIDQSERLVYAILKELQIQNHGELTAFMADQAGRVTYSGNKHIPSNDSASL